MIESQFANVPPRKKLHPSKRRRKNYDVIVLPDRMAKGRSSKGKDFRKRTRIKGRAPLMGDNVYRTDDNLEDAMYWLRVRRT